MAEQMEFIYALRADVSDAQVLTKEMATIEAVANRTGQSLGSSFKVLSRDINKTWVDTSGAYRQVTSIVQNSEGQFKKIVQIQKDAGSGWEQQTNAMRIYSATAKDVPGAIDSIGINLGKLISRALVTIPVWMALRTAMQAVIGIVKDTISAYTDLDVGMRKVMAVATFTAETQTRTYAELEAKARQYYATSNASYKQITDAMYELGSAGLSTKQIMQGFNQVMDLSIATYTDTGTVAKSVASIFNVFGQELARVGDTSQQFQYVADLLTSTWRESQIEISELTQAMSYLGSVGSNAGISLEQLVAASATLSDGFMKGGKGGRLLARAIAEIADNSDKLRGLGVAFDPYKPMKFYDIMSQLHDMYLEQGKNVNMLSGLMNVFGMEGGRAVFTLLQQWEKFNLEIGKTPDVINGTAKRMKEMRQMSYKDLMEISKHQLQTLSGDEGTGTSPAKESLMKNIIGNEETLARINKIVDSVKLLKENLGLTKEEILEVGVSLYTMGQQNRANKMILDMGYSLKELDKAVEEAYRKSTMPELNTGSDKAIDAIIKKYDLLKKSGLADVFAEAKTNIDEMGKSTEVVAEKTKLISDNGEFVNTLLVQWGKENKNISDIDDEQLQRIQKLLGLDKERLEVIREMVKLRLSQLKSNDTDNGGLNPQQMQALTDAKNSANYEDMKAKGLKESVISYAKINDEVKKYNNATKTNRKEIPELSPANVTDFNTETLVSMKVSPEMIAKLQKLSLDYQKQIKLETMELTAKEKENLDVQGQISAIQQSHLYTAGQKILLEMRSIENSQNLYTQHEKRLKLYELEKQYALEINKEVEDIASAFKETFQGELKGVLSGKQSANDMFVNLGNAQKDAMFDKASEGLTNTFFEQTGVGSAMGMSGMGLNRILSGEGDDVKSVIENAHYDGVERACRLIENAHVKGLSSIDGSGTYKSSTSGLAGSVASGGASGALSTASSVFSAFSMGNSKAVPQVQTSGQGYQLIRNADGTTKAIPASQIKGATTSTSGMSLGKMGANVAGVALTAYSGYQSAKAGGQSTGVALGSSIGGAVGSAMFGGAMTAMLTTGVALGPVGWIGLGLMAGAMALGAFGSKKSSSQSSESKTTETKVASKIDVTNKNLEVINRNLIDLKQVMTYVLPNSSYFSEKRNIEDEFSLSMRRGLATG